MPKTPAKLNDKHRRFAKEYLIDLNATQAAIRAGYSQKTAGPQGHALLKNPKIQEIIQAGVRKTSEKLEITRERIMAEYAKIAFADIADFSDWDAHGNTRLTASKDLGEKTAAISEITVRDEMGSEDEAPSRLIKFKLHPKREALDSICKMQGWFTEKRELSGPNGTPLAVAVDLSALTDDELRVAQRLAARLSTPDADTGPGTGPAE